MKKQYGKIIFYKPIKIYHNLKKKSKRGSLHGWTMLLLESTNCWMKIAVPGR